MVRFLDGPVAGTTLQLTRAPQLLRAVRDPEGKVDALDMLHDEPAKDEEIFVYQRERFLSAVFVEYFATSRRGGQAFFQTDYSALPEQPGDDEVRTTEAWRAWCETRKGAVEDEQSI